MSIKRIIGIITGALFLAFGGPTIFLLTTLGAASLAYAFDAAYVFTGVQLLSVPVMPLLMLAFALSLMLPLWSALFGFAIGAAYGINNGMVKGIEGISAQFKGVSSLFILAAVSAPFLFFFCGQLFGGINFVAMIARMMAMNAGGMPVEAVESYMQGLLPGLLFDIGLPNLTSFVGAVLYVLPGFMNACIGAIVLAIAMFTGAFVGSIWHKGGAQPPSSGKGDIPTYIPP